jgi:hypothetical protein
MTPDDGQVYPKHVESFTKIKLRNSASYWLLLHERSAFLVIYTVWGQINGRHIEHIKIRKYVPIRNRFVPNLCHNDKNI